MRRAGWMERARSIEEFVGDPVGRFWLGATHLVWCHSPGLCGSTSWGRPTERDVRQYCAASTFTKHPGLARGFVALIDNRALEHVDWRTLSIVVDHIRELRPTWDQRIRRQAVAIPSGIVGFLLAGMSPLLGIAYPARFFAAIGEAIAWLDHSELPAAASEVEILVDEARGTSPLLRALRDHLDRSLHSAGVGTAARALGMATRSLQRELGRAKTSFSSELDRARVRAASALLVQTDEKVEVIALRVGCETASRLRVVFRRCIGETPNDHRARLRKAT